MLAWTAYGSGSLEGGQFYIHYWAIFREGKRLERASRVQSSKRSDGKIGSTSCPDVSNEQFSVLQETLQEIELELLQLLVGVVLLV
jgi:hypothetical protein